MYTETIAFIVPVMKRFDLFTRMMNSVDYPIKPYVIDNYNENRGVAAAWNLGMQKAFMDGYEYAIISNDDVEFKPNSIKIIHETLKETGAVMVSANQNGNYNGEEPLVNNMDFFCFGVNIKKLIETCGSFDENFFPAYFEDNDMAYRIVLSGEKAYQHRDAVVMHAGSATQNADPNNPVCPSAQFEGLRTYFFNKWGGVPGEERWTKPFNNDEKQIWDW